MCDEHERSGDVFNAASQPEVSFVGRFVSSPAPTFEGEVELAIRG